MLFTAYAIVRTVPSANRPNRRKKKDGDICRAVAAIADLPSSTLPDSPFILALGTPAAQNVPPQTGTLAHRALEEWERTLCENKAVPCRDASRPTGPHPKRWQNAYCHCPSQATCGRQGISGRLCSFHSRNDQDSARKAKSSTYYGNIHSRAYGLHVLRFWM